MSEGDERRDDAADGTDEGITPTPESASSTAPATAPRWAADEPTAMWGDGQLREEGYSGVADAPGRAPTTPATGPDVGGAERASVVSHGGHAPAPGATQPQARGGGMSWSMTIAIAIAIAVIVYFAVRTLR